MSTLQIVREYMEKKVKAEPQRKIFHISENEKQILQQSFEWDEYHNRLSYYKNIYQKTTWGDCMLLPSEVGAITHWLIHPNSISLRKKLNKMVCGQCRGYGFDEEETCDSCNGSGWETH